MCNIATYYIGCLRAVGNISDFGDPNTRQGIRRKIKIENLNGNIIELTLWDEMANHFYQADIKNMEQPVIIAVSSCRASKYRDYQLSASSATYYYLNPNIPEAAKSRVVFKARYEDSPPLIICKLPYQDVQQEKTRNRFPLKMIMEQNPNNYKGYITDTTATTLVTFFSPAADKAAEHPCTELVEKYKPVDPKKIPPEILAAQGKTSVFQFHLNTLGNHRDLNLDAIFNLKKQDKNTGTSAQEPSKGTPSSASAVTTQSMEKQDKTQTGKEKCPAEEEGTTPPTYSTITYATKKKGETEITQGKSVKRTLFDQQVTDPKKQKGD
ncbi:nucleic acid-binding, OB-fold protein [Tanacetum coccineum]|uniref:Nucleic acid-binding, OB-fold protein n=1 Tax=Tanacetum coccineum TaxID=301880 RepID=A0ABQ4XVM4_9ASTR